VNYPFKDRKCYLFWLIYEVKGYISHYSVYIYYRGLECLTSNKVVANSFHIIIPIVVVVIISAV